MPYLFCPAHAQEHEESCREGEEEYRRLGETVVMVSGTLISGPWQCDRCNARLGKGGAATLMTAFPSSYANELADYDYGKERRYFRVAEAAIKVYGAMPPGGLPRPAAVHGETA